MTTALTPTNIHTRDQNYSLSETKIKYMQSKAMHLHLTDTYYIGERVLYVPVSVRTQFIHVTSAALATSTMTMRRQRVDV